MSLTLLALASAATVTWPAPAAAVHRDEWFGLNATYFMGEHWSHSRGKSREEAFIVQRSAEEFSALAISQVRVDLDWPSVEPRPPSPERRDYQWAGADGTAFSLALSGKRWSPVIAYSPDWATSYHGTRGAPPRDLRDYAALVGTFAARYGSRGHWWDEVERRPSTPPPRLPIKRYEVWNEPNLPHFWRPQPDPATYAEMFLTAREAIKAADPDGAVIIGGLAPGGAATFLEGMAHALPAADGVGLHPYGRGVGEALAQVQRVRRVLAAVGHPRLPIHITEIGWPTQGSGQMSAPPVPDATRAGNLTLLAEVLARSDCGVASFEPYSWVSAQRDPDNDEDWLGIWPHAHTHSASSRAYTALVKRHLLPRTGRRLKLCDVTRRRPARPLRLRLSARRTSGGCVAATVRYRRLPLNAIKVRVGTRRSVTVATDQHGVARTCDPVVGLAKDSLVLKAAVSRAAASNTVRLR